MKQAIESIRYRTFADQLLSAPLATDPRIGQQFDKIDAVADAVSGQLQERWQLRQYSKLPDSLRLVTVVGCMPSLAAVRAEQSHDIVTAKKVNDNLRGIAKTILDSPRLWLHDTNKNHRNDIDRRNIAGQIAKLGILSTLWWSVANEIRDPQTYIWPGTTKQDRGGDTNSAYRTGFDLIMRQDDIKKTQLIQVKSRLERGQSAENYEPGIAVVVLNRLFRKQGSSLSPRFLLRMLVDGNHQELGNINKQIDKRIKEAHERAKSHENKSVTVQFSER